MNAIGTQGNYYYNYDMLGVGMTAKHLPSEMTKTSEAKEGAC